MHVEPPLQACWGNQSPREIVWVANVVMLGRSAAAART